MPRTVITRGFAGEDHAGGAASVLFVDAAPGGGPRPHRHRFFETEWLD